ncbi:MAG: sensor domain-containing diguanylate cyclase [Pseudomonadota bacterium]
MKDQSKTKQALLEENSLLKQKIQELDHTESERKQAEEELSQAYSFSSAIIDNISEGLCVCHETTEYPFVKFTIWNDRMTEITGYTMDEINRMGWYQTLYPDHELQARAIERMKRMRQSKDLSSEEWEITRADGNKRVLSISSSVVESGDGVAHILALMQDITERKRMEEEVLTLSITDQLTGLYNRRGFLSLAEQQLKLSERNKDGLLLFFADLDLLKRINDVLGHEEGDKALIEAANIFKETFRTSDIIARLGGDEFAVLAIDIKGTNSEVFITRLQQLIDIWNNQENREYKLSISMGYAYYDPENPCSIDDLMARADKSMYEQKQNKKGILLQFNNEGRFHV